MPENRSLFDGADVVGIGWGERPKDAGQPTDIAALRRFARDCGLLPADNALSQWGAEISAAADEIEALRAEVLALKKGNATLSRKAAALQRIADGKGLDVTTQEQTP